MTVSTEQNPGVALIPWSAELLQQANARLARQGHAGTVPINILTCSGLIGDIALRVARRRMIEQALNEKGLPLLCFRHRSRGPDWQF
jgi:hypothetical protein